MPIVTVADMIERARSRCDAMRIAPPSGTESSRAAAREILQALDALQPIYEQHMLIEQLRAPEGAEVSLFCDNPDFNMAPNSAIEITDDWTGWEPRRFDGDTLLDCLQKALAARTADEILRKQERRDDGR